MGDPIKPNFFVIGASKCGTTSLCNHLANHPEIFFSVPKEPAYFTLGPERGMSGADYAELFAGARAFRAIGEGSTNYGAVTLFPGVEHRIAAYSPNARIIYSVRHPLERMESQWNQLRSTGGTLLEFNDAVRQVPEMIETNLFWKTACAYRRVVGDERMLVLFLEDFQADAAATLTRCFEFLGVNPDATPESPDRALNRRADLREDGALLRAARRLPGFAMIRDALVPPAMRRAAKRPFTRSTPSRPTWDRDTLEWASAQIVEDNRMLLAHYGKPADFWHYGSEWLTRRNSRT